MSSALQLGLSAARVVAATLRLATERAEGKPEAHAGADYARLLEGLPLAARSAVLAALREQVEESQAAREKRARDSALVGEVFGRAALVAAGAGLALGLGPVGEAILGAVELVERGDDAGGLAVLRSIAGELVGQP